MFLKSIPSFATIAILLVAPMPLMAQSEDPGKTYFKTNCALCHADVLTTGDTEIIRLGPSLVGIDGRKAASQVNYSYSDALKNSGLTWDQTSLDKFLTSPNADVPGTRMPLTVPNADDRAKLIAYLSSLKLPPDYKPAPKISTIGDQNDWRHDAPGMVHRIGLADLPPPFATVSVGNNPRVVAPPPDAQVSVPAGFTVKKFATGFSNPRVLRVAPNGDIFLAETGPSRVRVLRADDGADAPKENEVFADGLDHPFGIAFYPLGPNPQWVYVANNNSVVRFPYKSGDMVATGPSEMIVPHLCDSGGGHSTRDIAFSLDGKQLFISVGSGSNVAEGMSKKTPQEIQQWEADHGKGADWDKETNRADILVTDPEGKTPLHTYATGIRNPVGIAVNQTTGDLWCSTNERDGLGDDLVPDYVTRVKEGHFYGWPWTYMGNHEDPRHPHERPDLDTQTTVPDVMVQSHSASLEMCFYNATSGGSLFPAEYQGDAFAAFHGSWNRSSRTGYKVVRVRLDHGIPTGEYDDFLTGFVVDNKSVWGRPVGVAVAHDGALLVSEDGNGTLWRISYH